MNSRVISWAMACAGLISSCGVQSPGTGKLPVAGRGAAGDGIQSSTESGETNSFVPSDDSTTSQAGTSAVASSAPDEPVKKPNPEPDLQGLQYRALQQTHVGFYAVLTPPGYDAPENAKRRYPVVVILHGSGSNEVNHGTLANSLGRDGIIYVVPRAPHPSADQFAAGKEGYTAWPNYPKAWGPYGSPTFPQADVEKLEVHKDYTRWIADSIQDARKHYRTTKDRAILVGHSQGGGFAHLVSAEYPWLVKAYVAYAGSHQLALRVPKLRAQTAGLTRERVSALLIHNERDPVVSVSQTQELDTLLTEHKVKHQSLVLPGDAHGTTAEVRRMLRTFVQEQLGSKERTGADVPLNASGAAVLRPVPNVVSYGNSTCGISIYGSVACSNAEEVAHCRVFELEPCALYSLGYRATTWQCVDDKWTITGTSPAVCGEGGQDPSVPGCSVESFRTLPTADSDAGQCDLVARCDQSQLVVTCDTPVGTSGPNVSCSCARDGKDVAVSLPSTLAPTSSACVAAAAQCASTPR